MNQTITIPQTIFERLIGRIERLEKAVFQSEQSVLASVTTYEVEKAQGKLKKMESVEELFD